PERFRRPAYVPRSYGQPLERSLAEQLQHLAEHGAEPVVPGLHEGVEQVVDAAVGPDVGLAELQEPSAGLEQAERGVGELSGQAVEDDVHLRELVREAERAGTGQMFLVQAGRGPLAL